MIFCIAGMHRSGTSMVAQLLHWCGIYFGPKDRLIPATPENPDGHWEYAPIVNLNDDLLNELGGGWDQPPKLESNWLLQPDVVRQKLAAAKILKEFDGHAHWGWKDPRTSLILPFWDDLCPTTKIVVCLRNPLEVAASLYRRGLMSYSLGLTL